MSMAPRSGTLRRFSTTWTWRAAHVERTPGERLRQHEPQAVDVGFCGDIAAEKAELFGRDVVVLAGKAAADHGGFAELRRSRDAEIDDLGARDVAAGTMMLSGETSRWMMPRSCAACRPVASRCISRPHRLEGERPSSCRIADKRTAVDELHRQIGPLQDRARP